MTAPALILARKREARLRAGHPWVYRPEVERLPDVTAAETVPFCSADGEILAWGYVNPESAIPGRVIHHGRDAPPADWIDRRLERALALRRRCFGDRESAWRLVFSEADGLPGLVLDRYGELVVAQETTAGMEARREQWVAALRSRLAPRFLYLRNEAPVRSKEGLSRESAWLGSAPPEDRLPTTVTIAAARFLVDPRVGHKTGFYLDQSENYRRWQRWVRPGDRVLDLFSYQGGFSLVALTAGAERAVAVDSSAPAIAWTRRNADHNGVADRLELVESDVSAYLRDGEERFDLVCLDPPPMAKKSTHLRQAFRKYVQLNRLAIERLRPGGLLFTFSCSEAVDTATLTKVVRSACRQAGRSGRVLDRLGQPADHPVPVTFPEAEYLRGLCLSVD